MNLSRLSHVNPNIGKNLFSVWKGEHGCFISIIGLTAGKLNKKHILIPIN
jgi:hypothetical protein